MDSSIDSNNVFISDFDNESSLIDFDLATSEYFSKPWNVKYDKIDFSSLSQNDTDEIYCIYYIENRLRYIYEVLTLANLLKDEESRKKLQ